MARYRASGETSRRQLKHYVEYALLRILLFKLRLLPFRGALWVARRLGDFAFDVLRMRRTVTLQNLRAAFAMTRSEQELAGIARACYRNFAMTFVEFAFFAHQGIEDLERRMRITSSRHVREAAALGRGIIYLGGHVGNWEMMGACMGPLDRPLGVVVGGQRNPMVNRFITGLRSSVGMVPIRQGSALKEVIRTLRRDGRVALVADQDAGPGGMFIEFLGRPASTAIGPARFAYRTGAPVVIGLDRRLGNNGSHEARLYPPIIPDRSRPEEEEIRRILTEYARILEGFVRRYPDQWFWMHRRWKTRPDPAQ